MGTEYHDENAKAYRAKYKSGFGLNYPEGHIIRVHLHILKHELGMTSGRIFDYGCGTGIHLKYFMDNGFEPSGCDIDPIAIEKCKERMPEFKDNFFVIPPVPDLRGKVTGRFDIVLSNQALYFIDDDGIKNLVHQFHDLTKNGGVFFATMMDPRSFYYSQVVSKFGCMSKVVLDGRLKTNLFINFKASTDLVELFIPFKKLHLGYYSDLIREDEGICLHNMYVGVKG